MFIDNFPSIHFMIFYTVIVSTVSQSSNIYLVHVCNSTAMRKPHSISPVVSPKLPHFYDIFFFLSYFVFFVTCGEINNKNN